jgi:4-hydroxybenzoate polyprenyltransferase
MKKLIALINSSHPMPSFAVSLFVLLFGVGVGMEPRRAVLVGLAVLLQQLSVGFSNDWLDLRRDQVVGRKDKPVAKGAISVVTVRNFAFFAAVAALVLAALLGVAALWWMVLMLIAGWAYNLGLKSTLLSFVPYAVGFGILPLFVTLSFETPMLAPFWIVLVAALLGISAHFANVLPDLFDDKATGVRALPHVLGQRASAITIALTALFATLLLVTQAKELNPTIGLVGFVLTLVLAGTASVLALRQKPPRIIFPLLVIASLVNVVLLMLGTGSLAS